MTVSESVAIALDLGTTSVKAGLMNRQGEISDLIVHRVPEVNVNDGRYESDALAYAQVAEQALSECVSHAGTCRILGLSCQRSSFLIWERDTGMPVTALISWQDDRGLPACEELRADESQIRAVTGLPLTPYYFAPKLRTVLHENPDIRSRLLRGELLVGTLETFLVWRWSGGRHFITDASMAARTLLMDLRQMQWSSRLCELFDIPIALLPEIVPSEAIDFRLDNGLILQASLGDQSAALIASLDDEENEVLINLGTGGFVARYMPENLAIPDGYLQTLVYQDKSRRSHLAVEGTLNSIAVALAPYPVNECRFEDLAQDDMFCIAEPSGIGAPYFRTDIGLMFSSPVEILSQHRMAALLLEGIIFRVTAILEDFHRLKPVERIYLSGGLSGIDCLQQGIAECAPCETLLLRQRETSLNGVALLAAGRHSSSYHKSSRIAVTARSSVLGRKYMQWKSWLDILLLK